MGNLNWLVETKFATETGYPNMVNLDSLALLSGREKLSTEQCILRSSIGTAKQLQREKHQNIIMFLGRADSFDCNSFMTEIPLKYLLNYDYTFYTWKQILDLRMDNFFARPNSGWKTFSGLVVNKSNIDSLDIDKKTICLVASVKDILEEYRFVIVDKMVISGTSYLPDEDIKVENEAYQFAQNVVNAIDNPPDDVYTLDVAFTHGGYKVIEWNSFTTSGLYKCDIVKVCNSIENYLERGEENETGM